MNRFTLAVILPILLCISLSAQTPLEWAINCGSSIILNADEGNAVASDSAGNVYVTGTFTGSTDFDPGSGTYNLTASGGGDIFVMKLNAAGNLVWAYNFGGSATYVDAGQEIVIGPNGNVYVSGVFNGSADFNPGPGTFVMNASGNSDAFLLCLTTTGNFVWASQLGGNGGGENIYSLCFDPSGNLIVGGDFQSTVDFNPSVATYLLSSSGLYDAFIMKMTATGTFVWVGKMGSATGSESVADIAVDSAGSIYSTGVFESTTDFDPGAGTFNLVSSGSGDPFIAKWSNTGTLVWARSLSGIPNANGSSIALDGSGNVYTTGRFWGTTDFDPGVGTATLTWAGDYDIYLLKLNNAGNYVWARNLGSSTEDYGKSIQLDTDANIYLGGYYSGTVDFDPGVGSYPLSATGTFYDAFLLSVDSSGNFRWAKDLSGTGSVQIFDLDRNTNGDIYTTGRFGAICDFNPDAGTLNLTSNGGQDLFVQKYYECTNQGYTISPVSCTAYTSPSGNLVWNTSGTYYDTIINPSACDSAHYVVTVNLTVLSPTSSTINPVSCGIYTAPDGSMHFSSSTFNCIIPNAAGCDSTITVALTVENINSTITQNGLTLTCAESGAQYQWIDCITNTVIAGANGQSYNVSSNGSYAVIITTNNCSDTSACYIVNSVDVWDNHFSQFSFHPNPASEIVNFNAPAGSTISLYNSIGEQVICLYNTSSSISLDVSTLPDGFYLVEVVHDATRFKNKLIIQK
jgi:Secretion system C-terminal sorting domain